MSLPVYIAPKLNLDVKRTIEIPFRITIPANAQNTVVSNMIPYPFKIIQCRMVFDRNARNLVWYYWFHSVDRGESITGLPTGDNIFTRETPSAYFVGEAIVKVINSNIEVIEGKKYIKLHTVNGLGVAYESNATIRIQEL